MRYQIVVWFTRAIVSVTGRRDEENTRRVQSTDRGRKLARKLRAAKARVDHANVCPFSASGTLPELSHFHGVSAGVHRGAGLTLRAGVPNLAIGPIALAGALHFAENGDEGLVKAAVPALIIAAAGGLIVAVLVLVLHVPGWAATLAGAMGVIVYNQLRTAPVTVQATYDPADHAFYLFGGFALLAVIGGALGTVMPIRRLVGRLRPADDPARRPGAAAAFPVIAALMLSSVFAVGAGILMAAQSTTPIKPGTGLEWTGLAFGTALLAGTSAYGRRGGIFGTLLSVAGVTLFLDYAARRDFDIALFAIAAGVLGGGLIVTRLVETYGRPLPVPAMTDWNAAASAGTTWTPDMPEQWSTSAEPPEGRPIRWDEGPWGTAR